VQTLPARRVVVVDESRTHLDMLSRYARAPRGQRAVVKSRRNYGKNITLLAGLNLEGICAAMVIEGSVTTDVFVAFIEHVLLPVLHPGDMLVLDNLSAHDAKLLEPLLHAKGCQLLYLPAYSPDLSPIENGFSKIKQFLRTARAQTLDALYEVIAQAVQTITPYDAIGYFTHAGFLNLD
jgi:transposase